MGAAPWTLERVAKEHPALAPLAFLHLAIEAALDASRLPAPVLVPTPGVVWMEGRPLLDEVAASVAPALAGVAASVVQAIDATVPGVVPEAARSAVPADAQSWLAALGAFRDPAWTPGGSDGSLARFVVLRTISAPARLLARKWSAPHPDRWKRTACPWCGVGAAASVARTGTGRTLLCVLCGGRWETTDDACTSCGERATGRFRVLASRDAGPASLEACTTCGAAIKVFSPGDAGDGPPLALEVATVRLDLLAERDHDAYRDPVALAAVYPPG